MPHLGDPPGGFADPAVADSCLWLLWCRDPTVLSARQIGARVQRKAVVL